MDKKRIVFMGTPEFACSILEQLINDKYNVVGVVSQPDKPVGRKRILSTTPTKALANSHQIPVIQPIRIRDDFQAILDLKPDMIITCAYGQILPKELLEIPEYGAINIHASLLPKHRGGAPIHHSIIRGDSKTGISIMRMSQKMDAGPVCYQVEVDISDFDTTGDLFQKLQVAGAHAIHEALPLILEKKAVFVEQDEAYITYSYNITKEDELIDFNRETKVVYNHIRGLIPQPVGYCLLNGKKFKLHQVRIGTHFGSLPGTILGLYDDGIEIATKDGSVSILRCQIEGKSVVDAKSFWSGYQNLKGEVVNEN